MAPLCGLEKNTGEEYHKVLSLLITHLLTVAPKSIQMSDWHRVIVSG